MKVKINEEFGRSNFPPRLTGISRQHKTILGLLLILAFLLSVGADAWPGKKTYFWSQRGMVMVFDGIEHIDLSQRYNRGHSPNFSGSLYYLVLVKFFLGIFGQRMLALRMLSIASSLVSIFLMYLIARQLFCSSIGLILTFLLSTSPIYLESMRAYGYIPFSLLVFILAMYVLVKVLDNRLLGIKLPLLAFLCFMSLALYVPLRLVMLLIVLFWVGYFKSDKKKLLVFAVCLLLLVVAGDTLFGKASCDWGMGLTGHPEWFKGSGAISGWYGFMRFRLIPNLKNSLASLTNWGTIPFADEDVRSRLFNILYTPFLFTGLIICLLKRRRSNFLLLLWFAVPFFSALPSSYNSPRRIIASLPAIYLLIALGLYLFFKFLSGIRFFSGRKIIVSLSAALFLGVTGGGDVYEYIFIVTKPYYNYSRTQLEAIGEFVNEKLEAGAYIACNFPSRDLIWGNPYFINRFKNPQSARRASPSHPELKELKETVIWALQKDKQLVYLYTSPRITVRYGPQDYAKLFNELDYLKRHYQEELLFSQIPGTGVNYVATCSGMKSQRISEENAGSNE